MLFNIVTGYKGYTFVITQGFGENGDYYKRYGHKGHNGFDLAPLDKTIAEVVIHAPHSGIVKCRNEGNVGYGQYVEILQLPNPQENGRKSDLAHLKRFLVKDGQYIAQGDPIGIMGGAPQDTGHGDSTGRHCHWTYKLVDAQGNTLNKNNGYNGAIDIAKYVQMWELGKRLVTF